MLPLSFLLKEIANFKVCLLNILTKILNVLKFSPIVLFRCYNSIYSSARGGDTAIKV